MEQLTVLTALDFIFSNIEEALKNEDYIIKEVEIFESSTNVHLTIFNVEFEVNFSEDYIFSSSQKGIQIPHEILKKYKKSLESMANLFLLQKKQNEAVELQKEIEKLKNIIWNS